MKFILIVLIFLQASLGLSQHINRIYVDKKSSSSEQAGTKDAPFKNIQNAVDVAESGSEILIKEGIYREEVVINDKSLTIKSYPGDEVIITGAEPIFNWQEVGNDVYKALMPWNIRQYEYANQIFVDRKMLHLLRWPKENKDNWVLNSNYASFENIDSENYLIAEDLELFRPGLWEGAKVNINPSNPIYRQDGQGWTGEVYEVNGSSIYTDNELPLGNVPYGVGPGTQYYVFDPTPENVYNHGGPGELLDYGEYWKSGDTLFVKTFSGQPPAEAIGDDNLIEAKKRIFAFRPGESESLSFTEFKDLILFASTITTESDFSYRTNFSASQNVIFDNIKAHFIGHMEDLSGNFQQQWASKSGLILQGKNHIVRNSEFLYSGGSAISVLGAEHQIINNSFRFCNYQGTEAGIINFGTLGAQTLDIVIGYNTFTDSPHNAISLDNLLNSDPDQPGIARIHHNIFENIAYRYFDIGIVEQAGNYGGGVRIDHNFFSNDSIADYGMAKAALYFDFGDHAQKNKAFYVVDHNIVHNVEYGILLAHLNQIKIFNNTLLAGRTNPGRIGMTANRMSEDGIDVEIKNNILSDIDGSYGSAEFGSNYIPEDSLEWLELLADPFNGNFSIKNSADSLIGKGVKLPDYINKSSDSPDIGAVQKGQNNMAKGFLPEPDQYPYPAIPHSIDTVIRFTDFDYGGQGVSYYDFSTDSTFIYRNAFVDIIEGDSQKYLINNTKIGEWLEYTVEIPFDGDYLIESTIANKIKGELIIKSDTDSISFKFSENDSLLFKSYSDTLRFQRGVQLLVFDILVDSAQLDEFKLTPISTKDVYKLTTEATNGSVEIVSDEIFFNDGDTVTIIANPNGGFRFSNWSGDITGTSDTVKLIISKDYHVTANFELIPQEPFGGEPWAVPGKIEAEDYDVGGQNVAYYDNSPGNGGGFEYRSDSVDIQQASDCGSPIVGYIGRDEWREYTIYVSEKGLYNFDFSVAADNGFSGEFRFSISDFKSDIITVTPSGSWTACKLISVKDIPLDTGLQILRINPLSGGQNHDYIDIYKSKEEQEYTLDISSSSGGEVIVDGKSSSYLENEEVKIVARANPGFKFSHWTGNLVGFDTINYIIMDGNKKVFAQFDSIPYTIRTVADPRGSASILLDPIKYNYYYNDTVIVKADPFEGWEFLRWEGDLESLEPVDTIVVKKDVNISGKFQEIQEEALILHDDLALEFYPNPAKSSIIIESKYNLQIILQNLSGQVVYQSVKAKNFHRISVEGMKSGLYILKIVANGDIIHKKILINDQ